jgi:hypothetical protein
MSSSSPFEPANCIAGLSKIIAEKIFLGKKKSNECTGEGTKLQYDS